MKAVFGFSRRLVFSTEVENYIADAERLANCRSVLFAQLSYKEKGRHCPVSQPGVAETDRDPLPRAPSSRMLSLMLQTIANPVSWQRMARGIEKIRERLLRAASALRQAGVPYAVIGGNAVAAWVSRVDETAVRNTRDVDILLRRADMPAAQAALETAGFFYRRVASLGKAGSMDIFLDGPDARVRDAVHVLWAGEQVQGNSPVSLPDPDQSEDAGEFQLINLPALVTMKLDSFRDKDRMHLRDLIDAGLVDDSWMKTLPLELAARLKQILDNPE